MNTLKIYIEVIIPIDGYLEDFSCEAMKYKKKHKFLK